MRATIVAAALVLGACGPGGATPVETSTWSIAAADPASGDVGVAAASCVPAFGDGLAVLVPGRGAGVAQALFELANRDAVYGAIREGLPAEAVMAFVTDPSRAPDLDNRQYGVVTIARGAARAAAYTSPSREGLAVRNGLSQWGGARVSAPLGVAVQGNILVGPAVVADAFAAFARDEPGFDALPDRLMRALEAGSMAGGDARCNDTGTRQTALTAFILAARGGDPPYAAADIGFSDQGTDAAPWLAISVWNARGGGNPVPELRRRYDAWRTDASLMGQ
jgi:uncharacterized Ntn-hydrolase superfamily protein